MVKNKTGGNKSKGLARKNFARKDSSLRMANEEGEILAPINKGDQSTIFDKLSKIGESNKDMTIIKGLLGLFIMFIILWAAKTLMELILSKFARKGQSGGSKIDFT